MSNDTWWYLARAGGFVAWALCAVSVLWGLLLTSRALGRRGTASRFVEVHRFFGGLSVIFTLIHGAGIYFHEADGQQYHLREVLVPGASHVLPEAIAYGILAGYLLLAVELTSLVRRRLPNRVWAGVHYLSYPVLLLGTTHAIKAGSDLQGSAIRWPAATVTAALIGLGIARSLGRPLALARPSTDAPAEPHETVAADADEVVMPRRWSPEASHPSAPPLVRSWPAETPAEPPAAVGLVAPPPEANRAVPTAASDAPQPSAEAARTDEPQPSAEAARTDEPQPAPAPAVAESTRTSTGLDRAILERARAGLERLDTNAYPQVDIPKDMLTERPSAPQSDIALRYARLRRAAQQPTTPPPAPAAESATAPPVAPPAAASVPAAPPAPDAPPAAAIPSPPPATVPDEWLRPLSTPAEAATRRPRGGDDQPMQPPTPTRQSAGAALPTRAPNRLTPTTAPARSLDGWAPQRVEGTERATEAPLPPEPDPVTGEVPPEAYRRWLRQWLSFAETYEG